MKKFFSTAYSDNSFNLASLIIRLAFGLLICINHGFSKLQHFSSMQYSFLDPLHIGHRWSLVLATFAEVFCALLLALGLFTPLAALILVVNMSVAVFIAQKGQGLGPREAGLLYLTAFFSILLVGPGRFSMDGMMGK